MRFLDAPPPVPEGGLFADPQDAQRYQRLIESGLWKAMEIALRADRDALFAEDCSTAPDPAFALAINRGAIQWITRWLHSGPTLMVHYLRQQERS